MTNEEQKVISAARELAKSGESVGAGTLRASLLHALYDAVRELPPPTLTELGKFEELRNRIWQLIASLELTNEEGEALITEIRIRMRRSVRG